MLFTETVTEMRAKPATPFEITIQDQYSKHNVLAFIISVIKQNFHSFVLMFLQHVEIHIHTTEKTPKRVLESTFFSSLDFAHTSSSINCTQTSPR